MNAANNHRENSEEPQLVTVWKDLCPIRPPEALPPQVQAGPCNDR